MSRLGKRWAGNIYGTNTGNAFVELGGEDTALSGILRLSDSTAGLCVWELAGSYEGDTLNLTGKPGAAPPGVLLSDIKITGRLSLDGTIRGDWESAAGTAGTFILHPHDGLVGEAQSTGPEQLHTTTRKLGALHLYAEDIKGLLEVMSHDFRAPRPSVAYRHRGVEVVKYADEFLRDAEPGEAFRYIRIGVGEPDAYGLNRNVGVELNADGFNQVIVQGVQRAWVIGKAQVVEDHLKRREKFLITRFRRIGPNGPTLALLLVLAALPDLSVAGRIAFIAVVSASVWAVIQINQRYLPIALVSLGPRRPSAFVRLWPPLFSALIAAIFTFVAAVAYGLLKGEIKLPHALGVS